jgi:hypothetical protein
VTAALENEMIKDFSVAIGAAWKIRQQMMERDHRKLWSYHLPELAATDEQIVEAEQHLGFAIDARYKTFLRCANGWPAFYQSVDLFGTSDLIGGSRKDNAEMILSFLSDDTFERSRLKRSTVFPIAATGVDRDIFVMTSPSSSCPGAVIWFAGDEIDRFETFDDYFLAMMEYNRRELEGMKTGHP